MVLTGHIKCKEKKNLPDLDQAQVCGKGKKGNHVYFAYLTPGKYLAQDECLINVDKWINVQRETQQCFLGIMKLWLKQTINLICLKTF